MTVQRILLVEDDDDEDVSELLDDALRDEGYVVDLAGTVDEPNKKDGE